MKLQDGTPIKYVKLSEVGNRPRWYVFHRYVRDPAALPRHRGMMHLGPTSYGEDEVCAAILNEAKK